jgi:hypothetical protein
MTMRTGFDPTRRNRNQGTRARGHGESNRMEIPNRGASAWWEFVGPCSVEELAIHGKSATFIVEQPHPDFRHYCSNDDVRKVLEMLPPLDLEELNTFVFRQPTQKQQMLSPNWGRLSCSAELTLNGGPPRIFGPTIFLEAQPIEANFLWSKNLSLGAQAELVRLREDGHRIEEMRREWRIISGDTAIRNTQLFRTLLHEVGHWVDHLEKVERPSRSHPEDYGTLSDRYFARPSSEREAYAHRYATETAMRLRSEGLIPFPPESA